VNKTEKLKILKITMKKRMFRWSLVSTGAIALFWLVFWAVKGYVPVVNSAPDDWLISYIPGISRWWDILIGPLWSIPLAGLSVLCSKKLDAENNSDIAFSIVVGFVAGIIAGFVYGPVVGFNFSIVAGIVVGIVIGFTYDVGSGIIATIAYSLTTSLAYGLLTGVIVGFMAGLTYLAYCGMALVFVFGFLINVKQILKKVAHWLLAEEN